MENKLLYDSWTKGKKMVSDGVVTSDLIESILQNSCSEKKVRFSDCMKPVVVDGRLKTVMVPGFRVEIDLPNREAAELVSSIFSGRRSGLPFPSTLSISKNSGVYTLVVETKGDYQSSLFKNVKHTSIMNIERFAKYAVNREIVRRLVSAQILDISPVHPHSQLKQSGVAIRPSPTLQGAIGGMLTKTDLSAIADLQATSNRYWAALASKPQEISLASLRVENKKEPAMPTLSGARFRSV